MDEGHRSEIPTLYRAYAAVGVFWGVFAACAPELQRISGLGNAGFGILLFLMVAAALPMMALLNPLICRLGARALPISLSLLGGGMICMGLATSVLSLAGALIAMGIASGALDVTLNLRTAVLERTTGVRLFHRTHAMLPVFLLIASPCAGALRDAGVSVQTIYPGLGIGFLGLALTARGRAVAPAATACADKFIGPPARLRPTTLLAGLVLIAGLCGFLEATIESWSAIFAETVRGTTATAAGAAPAAFTMGLALGRMVAQRFDRRGNDLSTMAVAGLLAAPAFALIALPLPIWTFYAALMLAGCATAPVEPVALRLISSSVARGLRGPAICAATMATYVGMMTAPPGLGLVADTGGWPALWIGTAVAAGAIFILAAGLRMRMATPQLARVRLAGLARAAQRY